MKKSKKSILFAFFMISKILASALVTTSLISIPAQATSLDASQAAQVQSKENALERETRFKQTQQVLSIELQTLNLKQEHLELETTRLQELFSENESSLVKLEETLRLENGSLGSVFDAVRTLGLDLKKDRVNTPASFEIIHLNQGIEKQTKFNFLIEELENDKNTPSLESLLSLWDALIQALKSSVQLSPLRVSVRDNNGLLENQDVLRLGDLALINNEGYLLWDTQNHQANQIPWQPENGLTLPKLAQIKPGDMLLLDPSKGAVFEQLAQSPSLYTRFEQAGWVGKIITLLLAMGLAISAVRGGVLFHTHLKIKEQQTCLQTPGDNPLGRLLRVYQNAPNLLQERLPKTEQGISPDLYQGAYKENALEILELRMMEVIIDEQKNFEKGLSMLKLLGALAPMLGLLGTVIGMIETFQVIVQYGNGDPRVMAAGISMALITTVMGLIAAMPLLLAHNVLSTQASLLNGFLEKIGVGLVAQEYEREQEQNKAQTSVHLLKSDANSTGKNP